jgi:thiamine pyrophosphokinase
VYPQELESWRLSATQALAAETDLERLFNFLLERAETTEDLDHAGFRWTVEHVDEFQGESSESNLHNAGECPVVTQSVIL